MLDVDLDHTEKRLKEQEEDTARLMAQIDEVSSKDYMAKIEQMYILADMDPSLVLTEETDINFTANSMPQLNEDADMHNECMDWNINDVISTME